MTLKYESEILFDLMKRDGDDTPSDVLPYESELKEKYLEQVEGAYPKLTDYRPEWLFYNLHCHLPADFPVESLSNVTNATVNNVVPYAFGSASLKGQTLVNLLDFSQWGNQEKITFIADGTSKRIDLGRNLPIKFNTKYLTIIPVYENTINQNFTLGGWGYFSSQPAIKKEDGTGIIKILKTTRDEFSDNLFYMELWKENTSGKLTIGKPMFIEYQEGMENWDIPYFEGVQSVQMPGLTTTGKNLLNPILYPEYATGTCEKNGIVATYNADGTITFNGTNKGGTASTFRMGDVMPYLIDGKTYIFNYSVHTSYYDGTSGWTSIITVNKTKQKSIQPYIQFLAGESVNNVIYYPMLEIGSVATPYEPYQSNILTVNEDIELRGIGGVKDELNLITGELTQRIGESVYKGDSSENWYSNGVSGDFIEFARSVSDVKSIIACDRFPVSGTGERCVYAGNKFYVRMLTSRLATQDIAGFKKWLASNPLTIQYQLATESIKTVDFTITDQDGNSESVIRPLEGTMHLMTEGNAIKPLFSGEIPVEATTQNLMSFVNMEMEE